MIHITVCASFWWFCYPKRPFQYLTVQMVESVDYRYSYQSETNTAKLYCLKEEDKKLVVQELRKIVFMRPVFLAEREGKYIGGRNVIVWVRLKNGHSFGYDVDFPYFGLFYPCPYPEKEYITDEKVDPENVVVKYRSKQTDERHAVRFWLPKVGRSKAAFDELKDMFFWHRIRDYW